MAHEGCSEQTAQPCPGTGCAAAASNATACHLGATCAPACSPACLQLTSLRRVEGCSSIKPTFSRTTSGSVNHSSCGPRCHTAGHVVLLQEARFADSSQFSRVADQVRGSPSRRQQRWRRRLPDGLDPAESREGRQVHRKHLSCSANFTGACSRHAPARAANVPLGKCNGRNAAPAASSSPTCRSAAPVWPRHQRCIAGQPPDQPASRAGGDRAQ